MGIKNYTFRNKGKKVKKTKEVRDQLFDISDLKKHQDVTSQNV